MKLAILNSTDSQAYFGTTQEPILRESATIIGQTPSCDRFLLLVPEVVAPLEEQASVPEGFDFTYCQAWGLAINQEVVERVWRDLRAKAYPPAADYLDGIVKGDQAQVAAYVAACQEVKARYPKLS